MQTVACQGFYEAIVETGRSSAAATGGGLRLMTVLRAGQFGRQGRTFGLLAGRCLGAGSELLELLLNGRQVGIDGLIEQAGLLGAHLLIKLNEESRAGSRSVVGNVGAGIRCF